MRTLLAEIEELDGQISRIQFPERTQPGRNGHSHDFGVYRYGKFYAIIQDGALLVDLFTAELTNDRYWRGTSISEGTKVAIADTEEFLKGFELAYSFHDKEVFRKRSFHDIVQKANKSHTYSHG